MSLLHTKLRISDFRLIVYLLYCFLFLITIGIPAVEGRIHLEFYADSETYLEIGNDSSITFQNILLIQPNVLGQILILRFLQNSYVLVFIMNACIAYYFYHVVSTYFNLNRKILFTYLFISPMFFGSVVLINKEMISILALSFFFKYYHGKNFLYLLLAIVVSFFVRWQMALFIFVAAVTVGQLNFFKKWKTVTLLLCLFGVSLMYFLNKSSFQHVNDVLQVAKAGDTESKSGIFYTIMDIQNGSPIGYLLVFPFKAMHLFVGMVSKYMKFFDWSNMYNNTFIFSQSVMHFIVVINVIRKRIKFNNIFLFVAILYAIIFALTPIYSPRYFFPVYILLACAVATPTLSEKKLKNKSFL